MSSNSDDERLPQSNPTAVQPSDRAIGSSFSFLPVAYYDPRIPLPKCSASPALCRGICEGECGAVAEVEKR